VDEGGIFGHWRFATLFHFVLRKIVDIVAVVVIDYRYVKVVYQTIRCFAIILRRSFAAQLLREVLSS